MKDGRAHAADRLVGLFDRLRRLALSQHPLEDDGVTMPQLALIDWVAAGPGCGISELATGLELSVPTVSVGVRRLEDAGLLTREPDPEDGRAVRLYLSPSGQELHRRALAFRRDRMRRLLRVLSAEEAESLLVLLTRAVDGAERTDDGVE